MTLKILFTIIVMALLSGCEPEPTTVEVTNQLQVDIRLSAKNGACGRIPTLYDLTCLKAIELQVDTNTASFNICRAIEKTYPTLLDFLADNQIERWLEAELDNADTGLSIRMQAIASIEDGEAACTQSAVTSNWILFGESTPIQLPSITDRDETIPIDVNLAIDCLDCFGGCASWGTAQCPTNLTRVCQTNEPTTPVVCESSDDCRDEELCVENVSGERTCALICPLNTCQDNASCKGIPPEDIY